VWVASSDASSNSNCGAQVGIGIEIDQKTKFIAKIGSFDTVPDSDPDSIIIRIAVIRQTSKGSTIAHGHLILQLGECPLRGHVWLKLFLCLLQNSISICRVQRFFFQPFHAIVDKKTSPVFGTILMSWQHQKIPPDPPLPKGGILNSTVSLSGQHIFTQMTVFRHPSPYFTQTSMPGLNQVVIIGGFALRFFIGRFNHG